MKRLRLERWSGQLLSQRTRPCCLRLPHSSLSNSSLSSTPSNFQLRTQSSSSAVEMDDLIFEDSDSNIHPSNTYASPLPEKALHSAKLAALHARLSLPKKLPLQTMARALVDPSADSNPHFNNAAMSQLGGSLISYYVAEYLLCTYPRLPISVLFAATYAYNGPNTLQIIAKEWGVETAAAPGDEVDPGLLQFGKLKPGTKIDKLAGGGGIRPGYKNWRKSGTLVYDDEFGDAIPAEQTQTDPLPAETAYSNFVKAVVGSLFLHAGREAAKNFVKQHILSRHLAISSLFQFREPIKELSRLCAREEFEYPVARILSETGRMSRTPVFVVGIYSGTDKLGEGAGASLPEARIRASVAALKAWYLYSPGKNVRVPSDMQDPNAKEWEPVHIDIGEIIS